MQTVPDRIQQHPSEAYFLLDRLRRQRITAVFEADAADELIAWGYARRSEGGLDITAAGLLNRQTS
ncbi:hypothetical protein GGR04_004369 [Aureimonas pseudogalii]|uniref:Uncharacterized protein n=1 Tax=Aureimonas pseudogalii TaxID=1744844 RepID=A0A7W6H8D5_9HYPH|nr:hypothetical protein [Aureimonas pseudogalii]